MCKLSKKTQPSGTPLCQIKHDAHSQAPSSGQNMGKCPFDYKCKKTFRAAAPPRATGALSTISPLALKHPEAASAHESLTITHLTIRHTSAALVSNNPHDGLIV